MLEMMDAIPAVSVAWGGLKVMMVPEVPSSIDSTMLDGQLVTTGPMVSTKVAKRDQNRFLDY